MSATLLSDGRTLRLGTLLILIMAGCGSIDSTVTTSPVPANPAITTAAPSAPPTTTAIPGAPQTTTAAPSAPPTASVGTEGCADVIDATIEGKAGVFNVSATVRSADTGWDKYADLWQVQTIDGRVLGDRVLAHPHETEQPFTRSLSGVPIPADAAQVVIVARDSVAGFCGAAFTVNVPSQ